MMSPITSAATPQIAPLKRERAHKRLARNEGTTMISRWDIVMAQFTERVVPGRGFEPRFSTPKADVLPLDDPGAGPKPRLSSGSGPSPRRREIASGGEYGDAISGDASKPQHR
jgi:hypothetical protein